MLAFQPETHDSLHEVPLELNKVQVCCRTPSYTL